MFQINKFPICIISSPRTSSTALADYLLRFYKDKIDHCFLEPNRWPTGEREEFFNSFFESDYYRKRNYIIKFHNVSWDIYPINMYRYLMTSPEVYRVRIKRRDFIKQLASYYIANTMGKWHYTDLETADSYSVPINLDNLMGDYRLLRNANRLLNNIRSIDLDLSHEDKELKNLPFTNFRPTPLPRNYNEIVSEIQKIYGAASRDRT